MIHTQPSSIEDLVVGSVHRVQLGDGRAVVLVIDSTTDLPSMLSSVGVHLLVLDFPSPLNLTNPHWYPRGCVMLQAHRERIA